MLKELSKVEQRCDAIVAVSRDGMAVTEVAQKFGVHRTRSVDDQPNTHRRTQFAHLVLTRAVTTFMSSVRELAAYEQTL